MNIQIHCPDYVLNNTLDLEKVSKCIDQALVKNFPGQKIVLRTLSSSDHDMTRSKLLKIIEQSGSDRYNPALPGDRYENAQNKHIDLFGRTCTVQPDRELSKKLLEGFHIYGAKFHGRPAPKMDIWLVYDRSKLKSVLHYYERYKVYKRDGYVFKDPAHKPEALLGILVIQ